LDTYTVPFPISICPAVGIEVEPVPPFAGEIGVVRDKLVEPPRATVPPPESPDPAVIVIDELDNEALDTNPQLADVEELAVNTWFADGGEAAETTTSAPVVISCEAATVFECEVRVLFVKVVFETEETGPPNSTHTLLP